MIDLLLWGIVAVLFMIMLVFFGLVIYYQFQLGKIRDITKEINIVSASYHEIIDALAEVKNIINKIK